MRCASSRCDPNDTSTGAAPVRPETARSSALASSRPASSSPSGTSAATVDGMPPSIDREHAHERGIGGDDAALGVGGGDAEWGGLEHAGQPQLGCGRAMPTRGLLLAAIEHQHGDDTLRPMAAADQLGGEGAAVLAQQVELEPRGTARRRAARGTDQGGAVGGDDVEQRERAPASRPPSGRSRNHCASVALIARGGRRASRRTDPAAGCRRRRASPPARSPSRSRACARASRRRPATASAGRRRAAGVAQERAHGDPQPASAQSFAEARVGRRTPRRAELSALGGAVEAEEGLRRFRPRLRTAPRASHAGRRAGP